MGAAMLPAGRARALCEDAWHATAARSRDGALHPRDARPGLQPPDPEGGAREGRRTAADLVPLRGRRHAHHGPARRRGPRRREWQNIPRVMADAVVAIEDQRFWDHSGIDLKALLRAAYVNATEGRVVQGASTITQQLVKNLYVGDEESLARKTKEAYLAYQLEQRRSKSRSSRSIEHVYSATAPTECRRRPRRNFDIHATELTLAQAALLAGVSRAPVDYDPVAHPTHARQRRNRVLDAMPRAGHDRQDTHDAIAASEIELDLGQEDARQYIAPYFVDYFKSGSFRTRGSARPSPTLRPAVQGGLRITTTLSPRMQVQAERRRPGPPLPARPLRGDDGSWTRGRGTSARWSAAATTGTSRTPSRGSTSRRVGARPADRLRVQAVRARRRARERVLPLVTVNGSTVSIALADGTSWSRRTPRGAATARSRSRAPR